jgi:hypothetical protein
MWRPITGNFCLSNKAYLFFDKSNDLARKIPINTACNRYCLSLAFVLAKPKISEQIAVSMFEWPLYVYKPTWPGKILSQQPSCMHRPQGLVWSRGERKHARHIVKGYYERIKPHWDHEIAAATQAEAGGDPNRAFKHLERAHVLGQNSTRLHTRTHILLMLWGVRQRSSREVAGQIFRIFGAATKTVFGLVPSGNTGGSNVNPFRKMPVPPDLLLTISAAQSEDPHP